MMPTRYRVAFRCAAGTKFFELGCNNQSATATGCRNMKEREEELTRVEGQGLATAARACARSAATPSESSERTPACAAEHAGSPPTQPMTPAWRHMPNGRALWY
jgi:hypothetical protein